jgi:hypothetical protein
VSTAGDVAGPRVNGPDSRLRNVRIESAKSFHGCPQSLQIEAGTVAPLGHDGFILNLLKCVCHSAIRLCVLWLLAAWLYSGPHREEL